MNLGLILLIVLVVLLLGSAPVYPYSRSWGYAPMSGLGVLLLILIVLALLGVLPFGGVPVAPTPVSVP
ncbi:MAG: DUF3309 family protein [Aureliella sp.]